MDTQAICDMILKNAAEIQHLHADMHKKHKLRAQGPIALTDWQTAAAIFNNRYNDLAFPGGYDGALDRLLAGDVLAMETSICFLELRPFFFRSGYIFKDLLRKARKAPLTEDQRKRLEVVERAVLQWRNRKRNSQQQTVIRDTQRVN
jgi:hypothetical protein